MDYDPITALDKKAPRRTSGELLKDDSLHDEEDPVFFFSLTANSLSLMIAEGKLDMVAIAWNPQMIPED